MTTFNIINKTEKSKKQKIKFIVNEKIDKKRAEILVKIPTDTLGLYLKDTIEDCSGRKYNKQTYIKNVKDLCIIV